MPNRDDDWPTETDLLGMDPGERVVALSQWFRTRYAPPGSHATLADYDDWLVDEHQPDDFATADRGPVEALDVLSEKFGGVLDEEFLQTVADILDRESTEWIRVPDGEESEQDFEIVDEPTLRAQEGIDEDEEEEESLDQLAARIITASMSAADREEIRQAEASLEKARQLTLERLAALDDALSALRPRNSLDTATPGIGHNGGPPSEWTSSIGIPTVISASIDALDTVIPATIAEVTKAGEPDRTVLSRCAEKAWDVASGIAMWVAGQGKTAAEKFIEEFSKEAGKKTASYVGLAGLAHVLHLGRTLELAINALLNHLH